MTNLAWYSLSKSTNAILSLRIDGLHLPIFIADKSALDEALELGE